MLNAPQSSIRGSLSVALLAARWCLAAFRRDRRGNVAIITALAAIPMLAAIGCVVDYTFASMVRTKLQAAADAATLATVSNNSPIVASAKTSGTVTNGVNYAKNFFNADVTAITNSANMSITPSATVTMSGNTMTATVSFTAQVPTFFMGAVSHLMGGSTLNSISIGGSSTATYSLPTYIDFYMMVDVSGSMSMASTVAEQTRLQSVNPDNMHSASNQGYPSGCTFACHFARSGACPQTSSNGDPWQGAYPTVGQNIPSQWPSSSGGYPGNYCMGFIITRLGTTPVTLPNGCLNDSNGKCGQNNVNWTNSQVSSCPTAGTTSCIQLRMDAVGYAVTQLLTYAQNTESNTNTSNEFRVGIFPFIQNLCYSSVGSSNSCSVGLTTNLTGSTIQNFAAQLASLLDTGDNATLGSGGTHFENAFSTMNSSVITSVGTGTSTSPKPYLFLITDGSQDYQTQSSGNWSSQNWSANGSVPYQNSATVIPPNTVTTTDYCTQIKNRGITIAVLYIPYQTIANANANFASNEDGYANANIANIPGALRACASTNFYYTATTPADIQTALIQMFNQAVSTAHISH
jgi:Flp pilus assembly protein TadG